MKNKLLNLIKTNQLNIDVGYMDNLTKTELDAFYLYLLDLCRIDN